MRDERSILHDARRTTSRIAGVVLMVVATGGCGDDTDVLGIVRARGELADARVTWRAAAIEDYAYEFERLSFPAPSVHTLPMRATVLEGEVVSAIYVEGAEHLFEGVAVEAGDPVPEEVLRFVLTIDEWFDSIGRAIDADPLELEIRYHPRLGYPELSRGVQCRCPDAGWRHRIERLEPIEEGDGR